MLYAYRKEVLTMTKELESTLLNPEQIKATKEGFKNLSDQLEFGRFNGKHTGSAPTLYEEFIALKNQRRFRLSASQYTMGDYSLQVFVNGQMMRVGADNDYEEVDNHTIEFTFDLDANEIVVLRVAGGTSGPSLHENYRAMKGQTICTLATSYTPGNHSLIVFVNGAYQTISVDYEETSARSVTFLEPLEEDDLVTFRVEGISTIDAKYQNRYIDRLYDAQKQLVREEEISGDIHIIKEYYRDADGRPERMIIRESGYVVEKTYVWSDNRCVHIDEEVKEVS